MLGRVNCRRITLTMVVAAFAAALPGRAQATVALSSASVTKLVTVEDYVNFLAQVSLMAGQVTASGLLTKAQKNELLRGSASDVRTASAALTLAREVANDPTTNRAVAAALVGSITALAGDTAAVRKNAAAKPLAKTTLKAFLKMGADAQTFVKRIQSAYQLLPPLSQPVELSLAPAPNQSRIFKGNTTVNFVLSGPKAGLTSANGTWSTSSGRENNAEPSLSTPFLIGNVTGGVINARVTAHSTATQWGAWTYIYYQLGPRQPVLLLLNLGVSSSGNSTAGGNSSGNNLVGGVTLYTGFPPEDFGPPGSPYISWAGGNASTSGETQIFNGSLDVSTLLSLGPGNVTIYNETLVWDPGVNADVSTDNITIGPSSTFNLNGNKITFANPIGGGGWGGLTVDGPGRLTLAANNTYTGGTAVSGATLVISDWSGLAGGYGVQSNGTLVYAPDANDTLTINPGASGGTYPWGSGAFDTAVRDADAPADITYPWGNSTYRVKLQSDGSWVIPALGLEIQTVSSGVIGYIPIVISGYEITAWPPPAN